MSHYAWKNKYPKYSGWSGDLWPTILAVVIWVLVGAGLGWILEKL